MKATGVRCEGDLSQTTVTSFDLFLCGIVSFEERITGKQST